MYYDYIRESMDEFIDEVKDFPELYSMAVAARLIVPKNETPKGEAVTLLETCQDMWYEVLRIGVDENLELGWSEHIWEVAAFRLDNVISMIKE